jgi:hypothetical protein
MLELTGLDSVLWSLGVLYWLLAAAALVLALWKGRGWTRKALWAAAAVAVFGFLPGKLLVEKHRRDAYAREASSVRRGANVVPLIGSGQWVSTT